MDSWPAVLDTVHLERLESSTVCSVNDELRSLEPIFTIQSKKNGKKQLKNDPFKIITHSMHHT